MIRYGMVIDLKRCIGCHACSMACKVENFTGPGVVEKCTFCVTRLEEGREPACVRTCPVKARTMGDLNDPGSRVSELIRSRHGLQFHKDLGCDPSVYYLAP